MRLKPLLSGRVLRLGAKLGLVAFALALASLKGSAASDDLVGVTAVPITATPITSFELATPSRQRFGRLEFRGGLTLRSPNAAFGGLSGLWRSPDGEQLIAVSDRGRWLTAQLRHANGHLVGMDDGVMGPFLSAAGHPLSKTRSYDTESLAISGSRAYVGVERVQEVLRFDWPRGERPSRARVIAVPPGVKALPRNRGLEALGIATAGSSVAGALVGIAEEPPRTGGPDGFILTGSHKGSFRVLRRDGFAVTDLAFLPGGDLLILERRYVPPFSLAMRLRLIDGRTLEPGAVLDGEVLLTADGGTPVDNMEGLAAYRNADRETIITLISDDNFSMFQRTVLLEFALDPPEEARLPPSTAAPGHVAVP
ncbi:esterase-like activity of phytase family protein [Chelatococcus sp. GCM10030263]|uniref:esterase-like activity of phytase family protein n=1 Tax=Chelatococcus sp. GCM10030263 TaxID=3273387 RepID=UPI00360F4161